MIIKEVIKGFMKLWIFTHKLNSCDRRKDNNSSLDESDKSIVFLNLTLALIS